MAEFPKHLEHLAKLTDEQARAKVHEERYRHCADMDEDEMLADIADISRQKRAAAGDTNLAPTVQLHVMKDLYKAFKYRGTIHAPNLERETAGRKMNPPLFKPCYPPSPRSSAMSRASATESHLTRSLHDLPISQQSLKGEVGAKLEAFKTPSSGKTCRTIL